MGSGLRGRSLPFGNPGCTLGSLLIGEEEYRSGLHHHAIDMPRDRSLVNFNECMGVDLCPVVCHHTGFVFGVKPHDPSEAGLGHRPTPRLNVLSMLM